MTTKEIAYSVAGKTFVGYLAGRESDTKRPGVLVCHDASGLGEHAKERANALADLGYVALALDLFGEDRASGREETMARLARMTGDLPTLRARAAGALGVLKAQPAVDASRTAAIGFCFGGCVALELARSGADVACVVGFHSTLSTSAPADAKNIRGKVLVCLGVRDPVVPAAQRAAFIDEMTQGGVDWQVHLHDALHAFTDPSADRHDHPALGYHALAARRSWRAMRDLFDEVLGPIESRDTDPAG